MCYYVTMNSMCLKKTRKFNRDPITCLIYMCLSILSHSFVYNQ